MPADAIPCATVLHRDGLGVTVRIDLRLMSVTAAMTAAHKFTRQCFVHLERHDEGPFLLCRLNVKRTIDNTEHLAGEFLNEVLDQALREELAVKSENVRNLLLAQAFSRTRLLDPVLDSAEPASDPLRIAQPDAHDF